MGVDNRFQFAIPVYGCGFLPDSDGHQGETIKPGLHTDVVNRYFDGSAYFENVRIPTLWVNGTNDRHFPLPSSQHSAQSTNGPATLRFELEMRHGHYVGWEREEIYAFADNIVKGGNAFLRVGRPRMAGVARNTMIWFCSDNGPEGSVKSPGTAAEFRGRKRSLYEGGVRVPGILEWPAQVASGSRTDFPAVTSDYLPTIIDALSIELADERPMDGMSLLPVLRGAASGARTADWLPVKGAACLDDSPSQALQQGCRKGLGALRPVERSGREKRYWIGTSGKGWAEMSKALAVWRASCELSDRGQDY